MWKKKRPCTADVSPTEWEAPLHSRRVAQTDAVLPLDTPQAWQVSRTAVRQSDFAEAPIVAGWSTYFLEAGLRADHTSETKLRVQPSLLTGANHTG